MAKPLPTYAQYQELVRQEQSGWDEIERRLREGPPLNWTGPRGTRPDDPTPETYAQFIYWRGRTDGVDDYRAEQQAEADWEAKRGEIVQALDALGYDSDDILRALGYDPEDY